MNADHLDFNQPNSMLPLPTKQFLMYLLNEYMPTGVLSIDQINEAETILEEIKQSLSAQQSPSIDQSKRFYQIVPQNGDLARLQAINTVQMYESKKKIVTQLRCALESIYASVISTLNPIDYFKCYWLRTDLQPLDPNQHEYRRLQYCIEQIQHPNERVFSLANIFKVFPEEDQPFANGLGNQCFLFHSTFPCNILHILKDGLLVAPNHIPSLYRFHGKGIYFWDSASIALKLFRGCYSKAVLLVCRVALGGEQIHGNEANFDKEQNYQFKIGRNSLFVQGSKYSETRASHTMIDAHTKMYSGKIANCSGEKKFSEYNKYMVPHAEQVKVAYVLEFNRGNTAD